MRALHAVIALIGLAYASCALAAVDDGAFRSDLAAIASHPSRVVGSDGYRRAARYLEDQIAALCEWLKGHWR